MSIITDISSFFRNISALATYMQDTIGKRNTILAEYYDGDHVP